MSQIKDKSEQRPNRLVSLKILIFLFFGALQCEYAFLPYHMEWLGFTHQEIRSITAVASFGSIICPILVGFILDRVSVKNPASYGKWLRVLLFIAFIAAGIFFGLLLLLEPAGKYDNNQTLTFSCNEDGGTLFIKRQSEKTCANLKEGHLELDDCSYTCEVPDSSEFQNVSPLKNIQEFERLQIQETSETPSEEDDYDGIPPDDSETGVSKENLVASTTEAPLIPPPHICFSNTTTTVCPVYISKTLFFESVRSQEKNDETNNFSKDWCKNSIAGFSCYVPKNQITWMKKVRNVSECTAAIECLVKNPLKRGSILENSILSLIDKEALHTSYYAIRIVAEIFPVIIIMLLNISILIAVRETSVGRGNFGHQLAFYPMGVLSFASLLGILNHGIELQRFLIPMIVFPISMFICAILVLFSGKLPLTPNEWWWMTSCGLLAIPMSALKRYKFVIVGIGITAFVLGGLWHVLEAFRHLFSVDIIEDLIIDHKESWRSKTFVYVIGSILAIPLIWNGEKVVDIIGHSNIFIISFIFYVMRFGGLYFSSSNSYVSLYELFEPVSFYLSWLALLLFIRHLVPKRFLALGQGFLVILFFALGRTCFYYGTSVVSDSSQNVTIEIDLQSIHRTSTIIAFCAALIYFIIYHLILLPKFRVPTNRLATYDDSNVSPQKIFHDERSKKGYFRY